MSVIEAPQHTTNLSPPQKARRGKELGLIVLAWIICQFAVLQIHWATGVGVDSTVVWIAVVTAGIGLGLHLAVRLLAPYAEPVMVPTAYLLNLLGIAMIYRLDISRSLRAAANNSPDPTPVAISQLTWTATGLVLFVATLWLIRDHRPLQRYTYLSLLGAIVLLLLPLVPGLGATINGATIWIRVGPFSFQPSEVAKILFAIFLAGYLVTARDSLSIVRRRVLGISVPRGRDLGPVIIAWVVCLGILAFQVDLGTSVVLFGMFILVLFVATGRRSWLVIGTLLVAVGGVFAYSAFGHVRVRVAIWLDPFAYADGQGFQIVQSLFGLANGGLLGTGWGAGFPQLVPFANSDFIIASFGEELGMTGLFAMLVAYAILVQRGLRSAVTCRDTFGRLLAVSLTSFFALQVFVIVGGVTKLIPMTGLVAPFLAAGGSALVSNWIIIALLIRISDVTRMPDPSVPAGAVAPIGAGR
jgi:cell division protein FtsW (lipid II flippase)